LIENFDKLWGLTKPAFKQDRSWHRARNLALSSLVCLGRRTITGMLTTSGLQFKDWSSEYKLFEQERIDIGKIFKPITETVVKQYPTTKDISIVLDDTIIRKSGTKIYGTKWLRDPLGPKFQTNIVWGQRFLQTSIILPDSFDNLCSARALPIDFKHCPMSPKPKNKNVSSAEISEWKNRRRKERISVIGAEKISEIRSQINLIENGSNKKIIVSVDGGYTNSTVFKGIPLNTALIGRIRKDAKIFDLPCKPDSTTRGRQRIYGQQLPTPEQIRQDESIPWISTQAFAAGKLHDFKVKTINNIRWRGAGANNLRLVVIAPLRYRLSKSKRLYYNKSVYLICSDTELDIQTLLQNYIRRWEIEDSFRNEKTSLGIGQTQTWSPNSAALAPAFFVASYSYLLLATHFTYPKIDNTPVLPLPIWRRQKPPRRITINRMISLLRADVWQKGLGIYNKTDFDSITTLTAKSVLLDNSLRSAVLYATN